MNRKTADAWTLYLEGQPSHDGLGAIDQTDLELLAQLRSDLGTDALLRASARRFHQSDADLFVHAVEFKIRDRDADERFVQAVATRIVRRRFAQRTGWLAAIASLLVALVAAAAWYFSKPRGGQKNANTILENDTAPTFSLSRTATPKLATNPATVAQAQQRKSLVILGHVPPTASDELVIKRLLSLGFNSTVKLPSSLDLARDLSVDLIAISSTVESEDMTGLISETLSVAPVPLVVWEPWLFDDLGLADCPNNDGCGWVVAGGGLDIVNQGEPLVHDGSFRMEATNTPTVLSFGVPKPSAKVIATVVSVVPVPVLFVYEHGAALSFGPAPARRVALFLSDDTARKLTIEGWAMFDLAVSWAAPAEK